jgi:L-threonylcarbamoyladenylate synthase
MPSRAELLTTDVGRAAEALSRGGLVAIPTETVYGLAADARQRAAVARIFEVKGRPTGHPLIVHIAGHDAGDHAGHDGLAGWVGEVSSTTADHIARLAAACWPGPLTMLVPRGPYVIDEVTGGRATVGLRAPAHALTLELIDALGTGLAAPSANRFGRVSPTTAQHVLDDLADLLDPRTDAVLDGGPCAVGVESTIVDLTASPPQVLRAGAIVADDVASILARTVAEGEGPSRASGMLAAHYAPASELVLVEDELAATREEQRRRADGQFVRVLNRTDNLVLAARELYADLREADRDGLDALIVVLPPAAGLGHALRDRLFKAAAGSRRSQSSRGS